MMKFSKLIIAVFSVAFLFTSCEDKNITPENTTGLTQEELTQMTAVLKTYADDVIVKNYIALSSSAKELLTACEAVKQTTNGSSDEADKLLIACDKWIAARVHWERAESYLFGPVDTESIDPGIDSWPLALTEIEGQVKKAIGGEYDYNDLTSSDGGIKGFHAIEYVLFANGEKKTNITQGSDITVDDLASKLKVYLIATSQELYRSVLQLEAEWVGISALSSDKQADISTYKVELGGSGNYAELFKTANNPTYKSPQAGILEILNGITIIAGEVHTAKIVDPIDADVEEKGKGLLLVESWFSHNSVIDFTNNMRGIQEAYFGARFGTATTLAPASNSLSSFIKSKSEAMDEALTEAVTNAVEAVRLMGMVGGVDGGAAQAFRSNLEWDDENLKAKVAVSRLNEVMLIATLAVNNNDYSAFEE